MWRFNGQYIIAHFVYDNQAKIYIMYVDSIEYIHIYIYIYIYFILVDMYVVIEK